MNFIFFGEESKLSKYVIYLFSAETFGTILPMAATARQTVKRVPIAEKPESSSRSVTALPLLLTSGLCCQF